MHLLFLSINGFTNIITTSYKSRKSNNISKLNQLAFNKSKEIIIVHNYN